MIFTNLSLCHIDPRGRVEIEKFLQGGSKISERSEEKFFLLNPPKPPQTLPDLNGQGGLGGLGGLGCFPYRITIYDSAKL